MKVIRRLGVLLGVILGLALLFLWLQPKGFPFCGKVPVDPALKTEVFWNWKRVNDRLSDPIDLHGLAFDFVKNVDASGTVNEARGDPYANFACIFLNPETSVDGYPTVDTQIALLWTVNDELQTYGRNGKAIRQIFFTGLSDSELVTLTPDGPILQYDLPGRHTVSWFVVDSRGCYDRGLAYFWVEGGIDPRADAVGHFVPPRIL